MPRKKVVEDVVIEDGVVENIIVKELVVEEPSESVVDVKPVGEPVVIRHVQRVEVYNTLYYGQVSTNVQILRNILNIPGDDTYDVGLFSAVKKWERENTKNVPTGIVTDDLFKLIISKV